MIFFQIGVQNVNSQSRYVDSLVDWVDQHSRIDSQYILTLHRISYRYSENNIQKAFKYYERVFSLSDSLNFTYGKSLAQINLGILLSVTGNFMNSNEAYFKAIEFARQCNAKRQIAISLNNIGENFESLNELAKCREYTLQAITINTELKAWRGVAINYELLQRCDIEEKKYGDAMTHLNLGFPFAELSKENYILSLYYVGYGKLSALKKNIDSANIYFNIGMNHARAEGDQRNIYEVYMAMADYLPQLSLTTKIEYLDSAYSISARTKYREGIGKAAQALSAIYDKENMQDSSMAYYHIYRSNFDSMFSENNRRNVIIRETDWQIKQKEIENKHLKELSVIQNRDIIFKNSLLMASAVLLILLIITFFAVNKNISNAKKQAEANFNKKIAEVRMESLRSQMNPHFIFNSLNSIENFMMRNERRAASEYLQKFSSLIRIILQNSRAQLVPFVQDLEAIKLYISLEQLRFNDKFKVKTVIDPELLNEDYQVPPLLIQPYVENAIIHGLSQKEEEDLELLVKAELIDGYIIYTIEDNGIGRTLSAKYNEHKKPAHMSVGLELSRERINIFNTQYNGDGSVTITDLPGTNGHSGGTRAVLKIKAV
ncbi:MAG: histidine kinase [Bacteroidetes bacterium]|nr:histidine kinase [Bacteroidota bacterium]